MGIKGVFILSFIHIVMLSFIGQWIYMVDTHEENKDIPHIVKNFSDVFLTLNNFPGLFDDLYQPCFI